MDSQTHSRGKRPGCVTLYAVVCGLSGVLGFLALPLLLWSGDETLPLIIYPLVFIFSAFYIVLAAGLWAMESWSRVAVLVITGLGILGSLANMCLSALEVDLVSLFANVLSLALGVYIAHWFMNNRERFR